MVDFHRQKVIAGNWKMHKTIQESVDYIKDLTPLVKNASCQVLLAVPFTCLKSVADQAKNTNLIIGTQNINDHDHGAYTGEISARMVKDAGAEFTILGHSERRTLFHETNAFINAKVKKALGLGLKAIVCVGENLQAHKAGKTEEILKKDLEESLDELTTDQMKNVIIAYEPIWAVGTNQPATPQIAQQTIAFCRQIAAKKWGQEIAKSLVLQYGGSVSPENAKEFLDQEDIDGLLVGGASLSAESFSKIVNCQTV